MVTNCNYISLSERNYYFRFHGTIPQSWNDACEKSLDITVLDEKLRLLWSIQDCKKILSLYKKPTTSREKTHKIKRTLTLSQDYWWDEPAALDLFWKNHPYGSFQFVTCKVLWRINCTKFTIKWWQISKHTWKTTGGLLMPCRFSLFVFPFAYLPLIQKRLRNRLINRRQRWVNNSMHTNQHHSLLENFLWNPLGASGALQNLYRCPSSMGISYKDLSSSFSSSTSLKKGGGY